MAFTNRGLGATRLGISPVSMLPRHNNMVGLAVDTYSLGRCKFGVDRVARGSRGFVDRVDRLARLGAACTPTDRTLLT